MVVFLHMWALIQEVSAMFLGPLWSNPPKEEGISPLQSIERVWPPRMRKRKEREERGQFPIRVRWRM